MADGFGDFLSGLGGGGGGFSFGDFSPNLDVSGIAGPAAAAAPEAAGGGGFGGWLSGLGGSMKEGLSDVGGLAKAVLPAAQLGMTGMGIYGGIKGQQQGAEQMKILKQQQEQQQRMAAPASAAGAALTGAGEQALMGGSLPAQQETMVQQYADQLRMQYQQYLSHIGMSDSSAAVEMEGFINQQVAQYRQQIAQSLYGSGLQGIQTALGPSQAAGNTAAGVVGGTQQQLAGSNAALAKLLGQA